MRTCGWISLLLAAALPLAACEARVDVDDDPEPAEERVAEERPEPEDPERGPPRTVGLPPTDEPQDEREDPDGPFDGTTDDTVRESELVGNVTLDAVRSSQRSGYDRVVFEFREGERPGYEIGYTEPPITHCGSGHEAEVEGRYFLEVNLVPAGAHEFVDEERRPTIGDTDREVGYRNVRHLKMTCDHHGGVTWIIGLRHRQEYRRLELEDPARLVIDVLNDPAEGG